MRDPKDLKVTNFARIETQLCAVKEKITRIVDRANSTLLLMHANAAWPQVYILERTPSVSQ